MIPCTLQKLSTFDTVNAVRLAPPDTKSRVSADFIPLMQQWNIATAYQAALVSTFKGLHFIFLMTLHCQSDFNQFCG